MVYAVMGTMAFTSAARRNNAHNYVLTRLASENMWETVRVADVVYLDRPAIFCEFRFVDQPARDAFWTDLIAQLQGVNGPVVGSWAAKHDCTHDEAQPVGCVESTRQTW